MTHALFAAGLAGVACLAGLASPALAQSEGECGLQASIVMDVVAARQTGSDATSAQQSVAASLVGEAQKYGPVVPAIAEWVYSLPEETLGAEVGESWRAQCENL